MLLIISTKTEYKYYNAPEMDKQKKRIMVI